MELDRYDRTILRLLQEDARMTNTSLAAQVNLSESACLRRVRALEESGLIEGYTAMVDQQRAGFPVSVFVSITLDRQSQTGLEAFADLADFERVHNQHLTRLPSVARVQSSFAMRTVTRSRSLPVR